MNTESIRERVAGVRREPMDVNTAATVTMADYNSINELMGQSGTGSLPVRFYGKINEAGTVTVQGSAATMMQDPDSANNGKFFSKTLDLTEGNHTVTIEATDFGVPPHSTTTNYSVTVAGGGARTFEYDLNGNLTNVVTATTTNSYAWDAENRLVKITQLTNNTELVSEFTYDGLGRRVQIVEKTNGVVGSTRKYIWSGTRLCEERDQNNNVTKRFFAEGEQNVGGVNLYFFRDHLGSIREAIGPGGAIRARYDYDPYGRRTKVTGNQEADFGFTGYYVHQPSGLQLALYRAYDADLGRFINRDPIGERGGINLYDYVYNDPANWIDPLGLKPGDKYPTEDAAAIDAVNDINPTSIKENTEYAGKLYQNDDGTYSYTPPNKGSEGSSSPGSCPKGTSDKGYYHTHGGNDPKYDSENFSGADKSYADRSGQPGYVGTPSGTIKKYTPDSSGPGNGTVTTIKGSK